MSKSLKFSITGLIIGSFIMIAYYSFALENIVPVVDPVVDPVPEEEVLILDSRVSHYVVRSQNGVYRTRSYKFNEINKDCIEFSNVMVCGSFTINELPSVYVNTEKYLSTKQ